MRTGWSKLGLRGRLALSIGAIVVLAFAVVFAVVRTEMSHESSVIAREEARETNGPGAKGSEPGEGSATSPIADAQSEVEKTFLIVGVATLFAALLAGYLLAARTASPLRRFAATAAEVDGGDLTPRLEASPTTAAELRTLAEAFNHMLDRLDRAFARQRQFVSDASHELRSPLTAIRGQLEVLARKEDPSAEEVRRVEAMTMAEMRRMERLLDDLLALARLDEGVGPSLLEVRAATFLRELAETTPGEPTELGPLSEGTVPADPDLLAQVIRNLLSNAHRHATRVVLSSSADRDVLTVSVDDDGAGVPADQREQVFDRFHRSEPSRDRVSGGSGLGLAIARSIVGLHGGRIWIEDSVLGGARVCFELPGFTPG
ncbi:MAG: two-component system, OmpR family, sensor kinase [Solirubrobacterales bacterium]|jgi:signal transduction histidine kinase|nr:two-component system, OmpR family, sensor kinase [Solirubrobacterales bacterium]